MNETDKTYQAYAITTIDNPFDPWTQFEDWYAYDEGMGYHSCSYLDRVTYCSDEDSVEAFMYEISCGIDAIIKHDPLKIYKKLERTFHYTENQLKFA